ncbi:hypothetical protein LJC74_01520 [Eubacteriales bacterium OttesenSCG-928-A19]|nr:hypothetical protein [Eubacteriales bacterium OttesenSCG-928-A19]
MKNNLYGQEVKREDAPRKRTFWDAFTLVENGRLKSTFLLYSFALAFVFLAVYILAFWLLLGPLDALIGGRLPVWLTNAVEGLVPGILATALCLLPFARVSNRRMAPAAYVWLALLVLPTLLILVFMLDPQDRGAFFAIAAPMVLLPLAIGVASAFLVYFRQIKKQREGMHAHEQ